MQRVKARVPHEVRLLRPVRALDPSRQLNLAIGLPLRNTTDLTNLIRDLYDPVSPRYHHYSSAPEFTRQFAPSMQDYQELIRFARRHHLKVTATHPNRVLLDVSGNVADIENALNVKMHQYQHPREARTFYAPDADPLLETAVPILGINGLDDFVLPRPMNLKKSDSPAAGHQADVVTGSGPGGDFLGADLRAAYAPGVTLNGAGQTLGLFELDGYFPNDITDYEILAKLPSVPVTNILVDGFNGAAGNGNVEVALDIEMAISMAPGLSQVMVYEGTSPNDILNRMATDNQAKQLSCSWGFYPIIDPVRAQIYQQFAAQGQTMFQASGDSGAYANGVFPPSDDPNLTIVGGTSLTTAGPGGAWLAETAWSGSGGGISTNFPIPPWQQEINTVANHGSATMRNIPDVSCLADVMLWIIFDNGQMTSVGGTSASAPLWAGFTALVNQQANARGQPTVGFLNPSLYAVAANGNAASFHDITTGNNTNSDSPSNFFAGPGYDLCTGLGSPSGSNLINALVALPDALAIMPATNLLYSGPAGGPFGPASQGFVLTDIGSNAFGWSAGASAAWVAPSPPGGALSPGSAPINLSPYFTAAANTLPPGSYAATMYFTNFGTGVVQRRGVVLDVVTPPAIVGQPVNQTVAVGSTVQFSVATAANALLDYQWQWNGQNLSDGPGVSGSATSALTLVNVSAASAGSYQVVLSNAAGVAISRAASLVVTSAPPFIVVQPVNQIVAQGATAQFSVQAGGTLPLAYQWRWNGTNLADGANIVGSSSSALTLTAAAPTEAGFYSVAVSNTLGKVTSSNATLSFLSLTASGVTLSSLYSFAGGSDGANPNGLVQDTNGLLYGTTQDGGINSSGTIFVLPPAGELTTLYQFNQAGFGLFAPLAALVQGPDAGLYGTAAGGGPNGWGGVFRTDTNGVLTTLANFNGRGNGGTPASPLILGADGALYGTTDFTGPGGDGTAFRVTTNGSLTTLAGFNLTDGLEPNQLLQAADGNLYGTTLEGGVNGNGTVFQLLTNGRLNTLASFNYTNGGSLPAAGLIQTPDGTLWGTTYEGGANGLGTVFQVSPLQAVTTVYSFTGGSDGAHPSANLVLGPDGNLYGTAAYGGLFDAGTVFRLAPNGSVVGLVQFDGLDGANPQAALTLGADGNFYGTTQNGGLSGLGTVFSVNMNCPAVQITGQPANQDVFLGARAVLSVAVAGNGPLTYQWRKNGVNLADGPGLSGSQQRVLTLSNVSPGAAGAYTVLVANSAGSVLSQPASLGVIESPPQFVLQPVSQVEIVGGSASFSALAVGDNPLTYQWQWNGTNLADGGQISGSSTSALVLSNLFETNNGSYSVLVSNALGAIPSAPAILTVYAPSLGGTTMAAVHDFSGTADGGVPNGLLAANDGQLYGTTQTGGAFGLGTIFSYTTNGTFTTLASFNGTNGATPLSGLVQGADGLLYGTTQYGGSNGAGTIFRLQSDTVINSLYSFASNAGCANPFTALAMDAAGNFYGAGVNDASPANGTLYRFGTNGVFTALYTFTNNTLPAGALTLGPDGNFYGASGNTSQNASVYGDIFRLTPGGTVTFIHNFVGTDGYSPAGQLAIGDDRDFYGVTRYNYINYRGFNLPFYGIIYKVTPTGALTTLYTNNETVVYTDGIIPVAGLLHASDGNFYGSTVQGYDINADGVEFNNVYGIAYRVTPAGTLTTLTSFNNTDDGAHPRTAMVEGADGSLYGTAPGGGPSGQGTIYRIAFTLAPAILYQPLSQTNLLGGTATLYVTTTGAPDLLYQWQENGTNLVDGPGIAGSTNRVLTLSGLTPAQAGSYDVIVSNALGWVTSSQALLSLEAAPAVQALSIDNGAFTFAWSATPGRTYQPQSATSLSPPNWTNLYGTITASNNVLNASDSLSATGQKFYRVLLLP
jgi:uncharacterized repeat protein (TIGR03803 family)